jgi:photosystem II stability/assembly factor-like uncharacterized protein
MKNSIFILLSFLILSCSNDIEHVKIKYATNTEIDSLSIRALEVKNENEIFFGGSNSTFGYSTDGGSTWNISQIDTLNLEFRSIAVLDSTVILLNIGSPAKMFRSNNLGKSWEITVVDSSKTAFYNSMKFWDNKNGIATGDPQGDGVLSILITNDGGVTWNKLSSDVLPKLDEGEAQFAASNTCVDAIDGNIWIATGGKNSRIIRSKDAGKSWKLIEIDFVKGEEMTGIYSVDFYDKNNGVIFGGDWNKRCKSSKNKFYTTDGGNTWYESTAEDRVCYRSCVQYATNNKLIALGIPGMSLSTDGGKTWSNISKVKDFYTVRIVNDSTAIGAGKGKIAKIIF